MDELKKFQSSTFDTIARRRLVEDQDTILELTGKIQELQNETNCMNDSRDFQDAESVRSGNSPRYQSTSVFPSSSNSWRNAESFYWNAEPERRAAKHLGHTWYIGKRFCIYSCVLFSPLSAGIESMEFRKRRADSLINSGKGVRNKHQFKIRDTSPGPSAKNSVIPSEGDSSKNYGADQQRLQISDLHFDKFPTPATVACWKIEIQDWGMYLFTISYGSYALDQKKWRWLIQWMI